jgi:DNA (cytosine-5)-methyltransferase 1
MKKNNFAAIDIFCGAGGLSHGLLRSGIKVVAGVDIDLACEYPFTKNNNAVFLNSDIRDISGDDLALFYPKNSTKILVGCAPCQPFSQYTNKKSKNDQWSLLIYFNKLVEQLNPHIVSMENVPGLLKHNIFDIFTKKLRLLGYHISYSIVYAPDFGIPQTRSRLVLFASLKKKIDLITKTHSSKDYVTVYDTIKHLPPLKAGQTDPFDQLHRCSSLSSINAERIKASKPGGSWLDWPEDLIAFCHKKPERRSYSSIYGRMRWERPSPTITTLFYGFGNGRFGHPTQNRAISLREGALLQTFPLNYQFTSPGQTINMKKIGRLIGNAVPVRLGEVIGHSILTNAGCSKVF